MSLYVSLCMSSLLTWCGSEGSSHSSESSSSSRACQQCFCIDFYGQQSESCNLGKSGSPEINISQGRVDVLSVEVSALVTKCNVCLLHPLILILCEMNPVHTLISCFFKALFHILLSNSGLPNGLFLSCFPSEMFYKLSCLVLHVFH